MNPRRWLWIKTVAIVTGIIAAWIFMPRKPSLRQFDPIAMGKLEADMWRCYYDKRYAALEWNLYVTAREQYGFSPWQSAQMAIHASLAAAAAQPVQTRDEAFEHALPHLKVYYGIIAHAIPMRATVDELARAELNWWVLRREQVGLQVWSQAISNATAQLYGAPEEKVHASAFLRADMMDYRDQHREGLMMLTDWQFVAKKLGESYSLLKDGVK